MNIKDYAPFLSRDAKFKRAIFRQERFFRGGHKRLAYIVHYYIYYKWHCEISVKAHIDSSVVFPHPIGVVIGDGTTIGKNTVIFQNVTLGQKNDRFPIVGNNCIIYSNSVLVGDIKVSDNTTVGAGSVVLSSTEEGSIYAGNPAKRLN